MRAPWLLFLLLPFLLIPLLACDDGASDPGVAPLGDPCEAPLDLSGEPLAATGTLSADHLLTTCGSGVDRADTVLRFIPPTDGPWLIEAQGAQGEPLSVSLREACAESTAQRACGDGRLTVDLIGGEARFVVIEGAPQAGPIDFMVTARPAPPPALSDAHVRINYEYETVGIEVRGDAPARPVQTVELMLLDENAEPALDAPVVLAFDRITAESGAFDGVAGTYFVGLEGITGARVRVFDTDRIASDALEVPIEAPRPAGESTCDPRRALDVCAGEQRCTPDGCGAGEVECPSEWTVRALDGDGPWTATGNTSGAPPHGTASCGGGSGSEIYRFTAPRAGQYMFDVRSAGHPDPLLFVRAACGLSDVAVELGCDDDVVPGDLSRSRVVTGLEAGQTVFVFVDGYAEEQPTGGAYRLAVSAVTAPTIDDGEAFVNLAAEAVGVRLAGAEPDADLSYAWLLLLTADGDIIETGAEYAIDLGFTRLAQTDGRYAADTAIAFLEPIEDLADLAMVGIWVTDDAGLESDLAVFDVLPAPALAADAECDVLAAFGSCPGEQLCARLGAVDAAPYCAEAEPTCPADWQVVDLHAAPDWTHRGDTTDAPNHGDLATCSTGGPDVVYRFVAPRAATYRFAIEGTEAGADSVLFARSHCAFSQTRFELACNDDRDVEDYLSAIELDLAASEAVYLFVGGYGARSLGQFTIQAR